MDFKSAKKLNGTSVLEMFSILYLGADRVPPKKQLGTISMMASESGRHYLYKVDEADRNQPSISFGEPIMVTCGAPIIEFTEFDIEFNLFCGAFKGCLNVKWENPWQYNGISVRRVIVDSEDRKNALCVEYGLFANATVANVEVNLLGDSASTCVYGDVAARNSKSDLPGLFARLFRKTPYDKIQVKDGVIPLCNTRVGVPLDSEFHVVIILNCDDVDYRNDLTLIPQEAGTIQRNVCNDKFQVRVTWGV